MNTNGENIVDEVLLGKYFAQETDRQETVRVETWLGKTENRRFFEQLQHIWNAGAKPAEKPVDVNAAWRKLKGGIERTQPPELKSVAFTPTKTASVRPLGQRSLVAYWRVAAGILLVVGIALAVYFLNQQGAETLIVTRATSTEKTLPDGSLVVVGKQSQLKFPGKFTGKTREVNLEGEAFFKVVRDQSQPFIVHTSQLNVQVLGTSFRVKANSVSQTAEVIVESGKVLVSAPTDSIVLIGGQRAFFEKGVFVRNNGITSKSGFSATFVFEKASLQEVASKLSEVYGTDIILKNNGLNNCSLTVTFVNKELEEVLQVITATLDLTVTEQQNQIILDGKGCE